MSALRPLPNVQQTHVDDSGFRESMTLQPVTHEMEHVETTSPDTHVRRVMLEVNATAQDLAEGFVTRIEHPHSVFAVGAMDTEKLENVIITEMHSRMTYSDCPESVTLGMQMFENDLTQFTDSAVSVQNAAGWLYRGGKTEWGPGSASTLDGYTNLHAIMPYERSRDIVSLYDPQNVENNRFIQTYGGYNGKNLWNNIIPFPKENYYYVDKDHVVMQVVAQNWDTLGINPGEEMLHENRYVKVAAPVVDQVVAQLQNTILTQMPFTNLNTAKFKFSSKPTREWATSSPDKTFKLMCELKISYLFPTVDATR